MRILRLRTTETSSFWKILCVIIAAAILSVCVNIMYPIKHLALIKANAGLYGLDTAFVCAIINAESSFDSEAVSYKGASGLMQLTESTAAWVAGEIGIAGYDYSRIFEPELNIQMGCYYISWLLKRFGDDRTLALAAYNAGMGNVNKWLRNEEYSSDGKTLKHIPFGETQRYIKNIDFSVKIYEFLLYFC